MSKVCVVIPTYNEAENLPKLVEALEEELQKENFNIIVVDDNSPDGTSEMIRKMSEGYDNLRLFVRPEKRGLGSAYKDGFKVSSGDFIVVMDADLSHNPEELPKLLETLNDADVAIGSRYVPGGRVVGWKGHRRLISRGANLLARLVLGLNIKDATSGFRAYKRRALEEIASRSSLNGFEFQVEALYIAKRLGLKVTEVPITFASRKRGKSKLSLKDVITFMHAVCAMRALVKP